MHLITVCTIAAGALALAVAPPSTALAQHDHQDLAIGADASGGGNLLLDYPFDERPVVRVSDSGAPVGLFTATDPGFAAVEEDEPAESVFTLAAGEEISLEVVAIDEVVSLKMDNGVDGAFFIPFDGSEYRIGLIGDGVCNPGTLLCTAGDIGAACSESEDCDTLTPSVHNHPEYQLLLLANPEQFAEGRVTFKLKDTGGGTYGDSPLYSLVISNGHLPGLEIEENPNEAKARASCQKALAKAVTKLTGSQYKLLSKCLDKALAAEHLGKSETAAQKACNPDDADPKSLVGRLAAARQKAEDAVAKACGPLDPSSEPFTLGQVRTHLGMASCRTQELIGAAYSESIEHIAELAAGTCPAGTCIGGLHAGDLCGDDAACEAEEDVLAALPCLKMSQATH